LPPTLLGAAPRLFAVGAPERGVLAIGGSRKRVEGRYARPPAR
jgi:hypothetical protein